MIRKILFITLSNIGDVILTIPCLSVLRGNFPKARITVLAGPRTVQIFEGAKAVDRVIAYDKTRSLWEKGKLAGALRGERFDLVVDLRNTLIPLLLFPALRTSLFRGFLKKVEPKREQHLACLRRIEKKLKLDWNRIGPFDFYSVEELRKVKALLAEKGIGAGPFVLVTPGAQSDLKRWSLEGFAGLADRLCREEKVRVVFAGSRADMPVVDGILSFAKEPHTSLAGETSLRELAALMSLARMVISNDSAPLQLAYELEVPVVAIFGPTNHRKFGRSDGDRRLIRKALSCSPCELAQCSIGERVCMNDIRVREVYAACAELLAKKGKNEA